MILEKEAAFVAATYFERCDRIATGHMSLPGMHLKVGPGHYPFSARFWHVHPNVALYISGWR